MLKIRSLVRSFTDVLANERKGIFRGHGAPRLSFLARNSFIVSLCVLRGFLFRGGCALAAP